ncbi:hypothetical protein NHG24_06830 [Aerococcaceae bacterium NML210727]|nr:hypothetical protein [Aerococcaceae bacterium NML210727]MCW6654396.1 hypothetical protein [Aerococcaceae bacterium NML201296]
MELGQTISKIRQNKNVTIKELCGDRLSRSAYTRFVNGETETSIQNFLHMLDILNVSFHEIMFLYPVESNQYYNRCMAKISKYTAENDIAGLKSLQKECALFSKHSKDKYYHLSLICQARISRLQENTVNQSIIDYFMNYLNSVETWMHYEIILFNATLFIYSPEYLDAIMNRLLDSLKQYENYLPHLKYMLRLLQNLFNVHLFNKDILRLNKIFKILSSIHISNDFMNYKLNFTFYKGCFLLAVHNNQTGHDIIEKCIETADFLELDVFSAAFRNSYQRLCKLYNLENKTFNTKEHPSCQF